MRSGRANDASLPDQRIRIAQGAIAETLSADWLETFRGSRAELVLRPTRFMFRPLELPKRAAEFLDGIVRAQIDRLTPWTVSEAVYSWTPPIEAGNERIQLTVAATARAQVTPYVQALAALGATAIVVSTVPQEAAAGAAPLKVFEQQSRGALEITRIRRVLMLVLAAGRGDGRDIDRASPRSPPTAWTASNRSSRARFPSAARRCARTAATRNACWSVASKRRRRV